MIASGTTSKQVKYFKDARDIGFGSMLGEGSLALASLIAAVAGITLVSEANLPSHGFVENLSWHIYYDSWAHASMNKATAFVLGGGALIQQLGFSVKISNTIIAVLVIGPKDFPIVLRKIGNWIGSIKRYFNDIQKDVSQITNVEDNSKKNDEEK